MNDQEERLHLRDEVVWVTKERDDYQRLSQEYTTVIMELKAENERLTAERDGLLEDLRLAEGMARTVLGQVEQILAEWQAK